MILIYPYSDFEGEGVGRIGGGVEATQDLNLLLITGDCVCIVPTS